jgi:tetratricopeptide (TPR) repeat protein
MVWCDKIARVFRMRAVKVAIGALILVVLGTLVYQIPAVNSRLSWRLDFARTYARGVLNPVQAIPTPLPQPVVLVEQLATPTIEQALPTMEELTPTPQVSPTPTVTPTELPDYIALPPPSWEKQDINNCGPASLSMYLRFWGWQGDQFDISEVIKPLREDRNVNVEEMDYYARTRAGWLNTEYRVGGDIELMKAFLAEGIPVLIEEGFIMDESYWPNDDRWAGHYLLLTGYDEATQSFIAHDSFRGADLYFTYETLNKNWQAFNRVYMLLYPPDRQETVVNLLGAHWDVDNNRQHALEVAEAEIAEDPQDAFAWFNQGTNLVYFKRYGEAGRAYDQARVLGLPQRMLRYQFGPFFAYFHSGRLDDLFALTEYALARTPNSEEALLWHGWGLYRQGKQSEAVSFFRQALEANPNYYDARYALDFVGANP